MANFEENTNSNAQKFAAKNPIEQTQETCEANAASTADSVQCGRAAEAAWDVEMNKAYQSLRKQENPQQRAALLDAQRHWLDFRDSEFESIEQIYGSADKGSMFSSFAAAADADVVKDRTIQLQNRAGDISNGSYEDRINVPFSAEASYPDLLRLAYSKADADLNLNYKALMQSLKGNPAAQDALRNSERSWLGFRDAEFSLLDKSTDQRYAGPRAQNLEARVDLVKNRSEHLYHQLLLNQGAF